MRDGVLNGGVWKCLQGPKVCRWRDRSATAADELMAEGGSVRDNVLWDESREQSQTRKTFKKRSSRIPKIARSRGKDKGKNQHAVPFFSKFVSLDLTLLTELKNFKNQQIFQNF